MLAIAENSSVPENPAPNETLSPLVVPRSKELDMV